MKTFLIRHCELGETRLSGPTLGELLRSDSGRLGRQNLSGQALGELLRSDTRKWGRMETRPFMSDTGKWGRQDISNETLGNGEDKTFLMRHRETGETRRSGQTLGELLRSDTGRTTQVRHWENC